MRNARITLLTLLMLVPLTTCQQRETPTPTPSPKKPQVTTTASEKETTTAYAQTTTTTTPSGTGVTVDIRLIGLCTIADRSVTPGETAAKTVILANHSTHMHKAMFLVPLDNIVDKTPFRYVGKEGGVEYWGYDLTGVQILLDDPNSNWGDHAPVRFSDAGDARNDRLPTFTGSGQNLTSLHWVPGMAHILGTTPTPKPEYFKKEPSGALVLARMALPGGELQSQLYEPYWMWRFGNFQQLQVVADEIHYTFALKDPQKYYNMYGRKVAPTATPDPPKQIFQIKLADPNNDTVIPIYLANIVEKDFGVTTALKPGYKDPHFELHYEMLGGNPPKFAPVVVNSMHKNTRAQGPLGGGTYCGPDGIP
jgi:hypothetical protein